MRRLLCVLLLATACAKDVTAPAAALLITASVSRDSVRAGDTVSVLVTVFNRSTEPQTLGNEGCAFIGFDVTNSAGSIVGPVWSVFCGAPLVMKTLAPGEQISATQVWTGTGVGGGSDTSPQFLPPGNYIVTGDADLVSSDGSTIPQSGVERVPVRVTIVP